MHKIVTRLSVLLLIGSLSFGQAYAESLKYSPIPLDKYLEIVKQNNALIGSSQLDVETATANKESKALYNFQPSISYSRGSWYPQVPYAPYISPQSSTYSFNFNVEGWGKRSARADLAQSQIASSATQLQTTTTNLETVAINGYIDTLRLSLMVQSYGNALNKLTPIKADPKLADSVRFLKYYQNASEKDLMFSALNLLNYSGDALKDLPYPKGNLNFPMQNFNIEGLVEQGQKRRMDVIVLQAAIDVAEKNVTLTNQNRNVDLSPYISQTRTPQYNDGGITYTSQNAISAGVSIPIPIANYLQTADIVQAANQKLQSEMQLRDLKVQIKVQVLQAFLQYSAAKDALVQAQSAYEAVIKSPNKDPVQAVMDARDKEGALLDAKTNHLKAVVYLWRQSGNYSVPTL